MSFKNSNLGVIAYVSGFTLWHYRTQDSIQELGGEYFESVANLMAVGDMLIINAGDGNYIRAIKTIENKKVELCELSK